MNEEQEKHLQKLKDKFSQLVDIKYRKGAEKHGGDLLRKKNLELLNMAIDEAIDQVTYLLTLRENLCP